MNKELAKTFATRVSQATRTELIVIMYEVILSDISSARDYLKLGDENSFVQDIKHGQKFLNELMGSLDYQYSISKDLMSLYIFINKCFVTSMFQKSEKELLDAKETLHILLEGFKGIRKEDNYGTVMTNTGQLYAGLTYGKGVLNETYIDPNQQNRGFLA
ncbi:MAG: flagellar protein FliS [Anaerocolumna sp.]